jgi:hypothetical protein
MGNEKLNEALRLRPWPIGDPWVIVEAVLQETQNEQQQRQVITLALDSVAATLQANLKLVEGLRQIVAGQSQAGR